MRWQMSWLGWLGWLWAWAVAHLLLLELSVEQPSVSRALAERGQRSLGLLVEPELGKARKVNSDSSGHGEMSEWCWGEEPVRLARSPKRQGERSSGTGREGGGPNRPPNRNTNL